MPDKSLLQAIKDKLAERKLNAIVTGPDDHGSVYVYFQPDKINVPGVAKFTIPLGSGALGSADYDKDGNLFGIELLNVRPKIDVK